MKPIIKIQDLSKLYHLGVVGTGTLSRDLNRWWARVRGKEDPYLKIGQMNNRSTGGTSEFVWALKDINLEIMPGEVLGIIGKNGAGKSTLLKILSKVTGPTTGRIDYYGRIGSLLEVGTGFHPELTGRENIFLNGAILGMTRAEVRKKLDEIVDFSGCERYIDTPVKRYSSGMTVRLGFAVAAHLEPEILVVDEVLAVGDAEFQKKAVGKMKEVSQGHGRTVLFVSHNMQSIEDLCSSTMILDYGKIDYMGTTPEAINQYLDSGIFNKTSQKWSMDMMPGNDIVRLQSARVLDSDLLECGVFGCSEEVNIEIIYYQKKADLMPTAIIHLINEKGQIVLASNEFNNPDWKPMHKISKTTLYKAICQIPGNLLAEGKYTILVAIGSYNPNVVHVKISDVLSFVVKKTNNELTSKGQYSGIWPGVVMPYLNWKLDQL